MEARIPLLGSGTEGPSQQSQEVKRECKWGKTALSPSSAATPMGRDPPTHPLCPGLRWSFPPPCSNQQGFLA